MMEKMRNKKKKGFTLVELIVVIAILGILAAIAVPRLTGIRHEATVKAEGATATSIATAARLQEAETGVVVVGLSGAAPALQAKYMVVPSSPTYTLGGGGPNPYTVTWTSASPNHGSQTHTEGTTFVPAAK